MKKLYLVLAVCVVSLSFVGCATTSNSSSEKAAVYFHDSASTDVVLRCSRLDTIHMLRPDTRQGGYLPMLNLDGVHRELSSRRPQRNLAVVVINYSAFQSTYDELIQSWSQFLRKEGFQRIVLLRAGYGNSIDGLPVVHDSAMSAAHERTAAASAAFTSTTGANAADSSGR